MKAPAAFRLLEYVPLLFAALCLPMALDMIAPNPFYGVRTAATSVSEIEWYRINRAVGIAGVAAGLAGFLVNLLVVRSGIAAPRKPLVCLATLIAVGLVIVAVSLGSA